MTSSLERRSAILRAANRLFEHYGHAKTTIADVAREAQVGVGTVYLEFDSKEAIVQALSLSTHVEVLEAMRAASERRHDDHAARLAAVLQTRTSCFVELRKRGQHACELVHCKTEGVKNAHERFREQEKELLAGIVHQGQRAGAFAPGDASSIASLIQRAYASLSPPWIFGSDHETLVNGGRGSAEGGSRDDAVRASTDLCKLLLNGLLANSESRRAAVNGGPSASRSSSTRKRRR